MFSSILTYWNSIDKEYKEHKLGSVTIGTIPCNGIVDMNDSFTNCLRDWEIEYGFILNIDLSYIESKHIVFVVYRPYID